MKEPGRLPKIVLGILGVWGLLAGLMLIHTLLATKQLHKRVTAITASVSEIDQETASIGLMQDTNRISAELLAASQPLPGTLEAMRGVTASLAGKVDSILAGSTTIENPEGGRGDQRLDQGHQRRRGGPAAGHQRDRRRDRSQQPGHRRRRRDRGGPAGRHREHPGRHARHRHARQFHRLQLGAQRPQPAVGPRGRLQPIVHQA
jgi:hypothetical protein